MGNNNRGPESAFPDYDDCSVLDVFIRDPNLSRKELAVRMNQTPTSFYGYLRDCHKVCVASFSFLADAVTGRPLAPVTAQELMNCGRKAASRHRAKVLKVK